MIEFIKPGDVADFVGDVDTVKLGVMVEDALADATRVAPCLLDLEDRVTDPERRDLLIKQVRSILRAAITRWAESGTGALQQESESAGPWSRATTFDTRQARRGMFWPSEITALQDICKAVEGGTSRAFNVDQLGSAVAANHQPWCSITWGGWCSCGANLTRGEYPLYEGGALS